MYIKKYIKYNIKIIIFSYIQPLDIFYGILKVIRNLFIILLSQYRFTCIYNNV